MNTATKQNISYVLRGLVAFLFLLSAVAKMYPSPYFAISTFEMKQLVPLGFSEGIAVYLSRTLIGAEIALGLLLLQPHYLKRVVIPATVALLVVFIIHLLITIAGGGNSGNCGCFGTLLPMTPLESVYKNVVTVALLVWLYKLLPSGSDRNNFFILTTVLFASVLSVFMLAPIKLQSSDTTFDVGAPIPEEMATDSLVSPAVDSVAPATENAATTTAIAPSENKTDHAKVETTAPVKAEVPAGPAPKKTVYSNFFANADKGKKIIALFVPGCEHCRDAAKQMTELKKKSKDFPELQIIFMDEEAEKIPEFFDYAGAKYPYKILDIVSFWKLLGNNKDTPGVLYLWNGNVIKEWQGIEGEKFNPAALSKELNKK
ncbi:MauE/DoxX family redox-associated membrane protein [Flavobacterium sp. RNTU_13]|uniref:MauE/DoxX family redox-associated membrane protein n=1 Tax=Flavobacterium sp. RNTU_13 TaxID=3375145 RepID=UPI003987CD53